MARIPSPPAIEMPDPPPSPNLPSQPPAGPSADRPGRDRGAGVAGQRHASSENGVGTEKPGGSPGDGWGSRERAGELPREADAIDPTSAPTRIHTPGPFGGAAPSIDDNLFAGLLAVHLGFVNAEDFFAAVTICLAQPGRFILDTLNKNGAISLADTRSLLSIGGMLLERQGNDVRRALDTLGIDPDLKRALGDMPLPDSAKLSVSAIHTRDQAEPGHGTLIVSRSPEGKYTLMHEHARGGLGRIMLALDNDVQREVAMKLLHEKYTHHKNARRRRIAVQRFLEEAQITGQLEHPNIVPVYEIGRRPDGALYYTMKFIRGEPLSTALDDIALNPPWTEEKRRVTRNRLLNIFIDVCNAIAYAHSRGVIHRDMKPENVMVGDYGEVLVVDWGLAKVKGAPDRTGGVIADAIRTIRTMAEEAKRSPADPALFPVGSAANVGDKAAAHKPALAPGESRKSRGRTRRSRRVSTGRRASRDASREPAHTVGVADIIDGPPPPDTDILDDSEPAVSAGLVAQDQKPSPATPASTSASAAPAAGPRKQHDSQELTAPGQFELRLPREVDFKTPTPGEPVAEPPPPADAFRPPPGPGARPPRGFTDEYEPQIVKPEMGGVPKDLHEIGKRPPRGITDIIEGDQYEQEAAPPASASESGAAVAEADAPATPETRPPSAVEDANAVAKFARVAREQAARERKRATGDESDDQKESAPDFAKLSTASAKLPVIDDSDAPVDRMAKSEADTLVSRQAEDPDPTGLKTLEGSIIGTPAYMPPEQAMGRIHAVDERSDIYALGAILYEMLTLVPPFDGDNAWEIIARVVTEDIEPPSMLVTPGEIPEDLEQICLRALARRPDDRYPTASELAEDIRQFLDGAKERERSVRRSHNKFKRGRRKARSYRRLRVHGAKLRDRLRDLEANYPGWLDPHEKAELWAAQDELEDVRRRSDMDYEGALHNFLHALTYNRDNVAARHAIGELYWEKLTEAEARGDRRAAALYLRQISQFNIDGYFTERLSGEGRVILVSAPESCQVYASRYYRRDRLLVPGPAFPLGQTPLNRPIPMGSYVLEIRHPEFATARYPMFVPRNASVRAHVGLIAPEHHDDAFAYIPGSPYIRRGDPDLGDPEREWADVADFFCAVHPVTAGEYLEFLNELHLTEPEEAVRLVPRGGRGPRDVLWNFDTVARNGKGAYHWPETDSDAELIAWSHDLPVVGVSWEDARAYIRWRSVKDQRPYRLPSADQWEKAARGVDGRHFPWGDDFDPSFANMNETHEFGPRLVPVTAFSTDESPFGIRGMAGNVSEWLQELLPDRPGLASVRGGNFTAPVEELRCARRAAAAKDETTMARTFRLVYAPDQRLSYGSITFPDFTLAH